MSPRDEALAVLRRQKAALADKYGVTALGLFGSMARGDFAEESDVDVVVRLAKPDLFYMVHIKDALEEALKRPVHIVRYRERMNPYLKKRIDRDAVYV